MSLQLFELLEAEERVLLADEVRDFAEALLWQREDVVSNQAFVHCDDLAEPLDALLHKLKELKVIHFGRLGQVLEALTLFVAEIPDQYAENSTIRSLSS